MTQLQKRSMVRMLRHRAARNILNKSGPACRELFWQAWSRASDSEIGGSVRKRLMTARRPGWSLTKGGAWGNPKPEKGLVAYRHWRAARTADVARARGLQP